MDGWERKLATRDTNRVVRPFEWGTDWLHSIGYPACPADANGDARARVGQFAAEAVAGSDRFYSYEPVRDYRPERRASDFHQPGPDPIPQQ